MRFLFVFHRNQSWTGFRQLFMATKEKECSAWKHKGLALNDSTTTLASTFLVILGLLLNENFHARTVLTCRSKPYPGKNIIWRRVYKEISFR